MRRIVKRRDFTGYRDIPYTCCRYDKFHAYIFATTHTQNWNQYMISIFILSWNTRDVILLLQRTITGDNVRTIPIALKFFSLVRHLSRNIHDPHLSTITTYFTLTCLQFLLLPQLHCRYGVYTGHVARKGEKRILHRVCVGKPEERAPLRTHIHG
jgi:hypothetical protein